MAQLTVVAAVRFGGEEMSEVPAWANREGWTWSPLMQRARRSLPFDRLVVLVHSNGATDFIYRNGDVDHPNFANPECAMEAADNLFAFIKSMAGENLNVLQRQTFADWLVTPTVEPLTRF